MSSMNKIRLTSHRSLKGGKKKSEAGQSELLLSLGFIILASTLVFAYNATVMNISDNLSDGDLTGNIILNSGGKFVINKSVMVEVWADTQIDIVVVNNTNFTGIKAVLLMDNGS
ncbi:MAG: hypothetical protein ACTSX6_11245, partial [Candidatus Heimdallarchaeaceae archaeon]